MKANVPLRWITRILLIAAFVSQIPSIPNLSALAKPLSDKDFSAGFSAALSTAFSKNSPATGAIKQPTDLTLKWGASSGATGYEYCYDETNDKVCDTGWTSVAGTSDLIGGLTNNTTYYWEVRAITSSGYVYANTNTWWSFTVVIAPPNSVEPGNIWPDPADDIFTKHPTFLWDAVDGADNYTLEVVAASYCSSFSKKLFTVTQTANSYTNSADLTAGTVYCWRVKANAKNGPSLYSDIRTFTTGNPPSVPVPLAPASNALITGTLYPLFDWKDSALYSAAFDSYEFQIDIINTFESADIYFTTPGDITDSQFMLPYDLTPATTYYWRVRAWNDVGDYSGWSPVRMVRMAYTTPTLFYPFDGDPADSLYQTFIWNFVPDAPQYRLQVSTVSTFNTVVLNVILSDTVYTPTRSLPSNKILYWRVQAVGLYGPSLWSDVWTVITP
jgi:hypothetical protein